MGQTLAYHPPIPIGFHDRSGRLIAAGILLVVSGLITGCITAMLPLSALIPQPGAPPTPLMQLAPALLMNTALAMILMTLGAGAIVKRRWARPLTIIFSTHWLIAGVIVVLLFPLLWGMVREQTNGVAGELLIGLVIAMGMIGLFMVAVPLAVLLLIRHDDVRRTLEHYDPRPRWTDHCPLPVLGLAVTLLVIGLLTLTAIPQAVVPAFGTYFTGTLARVILVALTIGYVISGLLVYRLNMSGWWLGLLLTVVGSLAIVPSALWMPLAPYYDAAGMTRDQIATLLEHQRMIRLAMAILPVVFGASFTLYMLRTRKHMGGWLVDS